MAAESVVDWSVHRGLYASIEPRSALQFSFDAERRKIGKQLLKIKNEAGTHLTYKIKTTGPDKFKVHPCTGVIASDGAEALIDIQPNMSSTLDVALLARERFLVCVMPISVIPGSQEALLNIWSNNDAISDADTHILAVSILPISARSNDGTRKDAELLGGDGEGDAFCSRNASPLNGNNCSSRLPSVAGVAQNDATNASGGLSGYAGVDSFETAHLRNDPRQNYEYAAGSGQQQFSRHYDEASCEDPCNNPYEYSDYAVSCSKQISAALILALSIVAWWGFHSVTPEQLTWTEWFYRKIGVRYWTP